MCAGQEIRRDSCLLLFRINEKRFDEKEAAEERRGLLLPLLTMI